MGIEDMLRREDFYKILQETIVDYYAKVRHQFVQCSTTPFENGEELRAFYFGNMVCRAHKPKGARGHLNAELNIRGSLWKYIAGKIIVHYMMLTKTKYSPGVIYLTKGVLGNNELISPQNRSIRVYDFDRQEVDCIIKKGFTEKYFNNQISFRKKYNYDFMVPLIDSGDGWFREPILKGHPLARVTGETKYNKSVEMAVKDIQTLAKDTLEYIPCSNYVPKLIDKAKHLTDNARQEKEISSYDYCNALLEYVEKELAGVTMNIPTCISHGDFQSGNIWVRNDGKVLLYDWETAGRRSIWYDCTTLLYSLRRDFGWEQFMKEDQPSLSLTCDPINNRGQEEFDCIKKIVLLEDYLFLIEDMMELPSDWGKRVFDKKIERLSSIITK